MTSSHPRPIPLAAINFDTATQTRAAIDDTTVAEYAAAMKAGRDFPAVTLFQDGPTRQFYIGDGWHRLLAAQRNGLVKFHAVVENGGKMGALVHALGANATHGLPRSNADKRKAIGIALKSYPALSDREIAKLCAVHHSTVAEYRGQVAESATSTPAKRTGADGKAYPATRAKVPSKPAGPVIPPPEAPPSAPPEKPASEPEATLAAMPPPPMKAWSLARSIGELRDVIETAIEAAPTNERAALEASILGLVTELCAPPEPAAKPATENELGNRKTIPPLPAWVTSYSASIGYPLDGEKWCDAYAVKGWKVGSQRMKDWQAAVRNWKASGYGLGTITLAAAGAKKGHGAPKPGEEYTL